MPRTYLNDLIAYLEENASSTNKQQTLIEGLQDLKESDFYKVIQGHARVPRAILAVLEDADAPIEAKEIIQSCRLYREYKALTRPTSGRRPTRQQKVAKSMYQDTYADFIQKNQSDFDKLRLWRKGTIAKVIAAGKTRVVAEVIESSDPEEEPEVRVIEVETVTPTASQAAASVESIGDDELMSIVRRCMPKCSTEADLHRAAYMVRDRHSTDDLTAGQAKYHMDHVALKFHLMVNGGKHKYRKDPQFIRASAYATQKLEAYSEEDQMVMRYPQLDTVLEKRGLEYQDLKDNEHLIAELFLIYGDEHIYTLATRMKLFRDLRNFQYEQM